MIAQGKPSTVPEAPPVFEGAFSESSHIGGHSYMPDEHAIPHQGVQQPAPKVLTASEVSQRLRTGDGARKNILGNIVITDAIPELVQRARATRIQVAENIKDKVERAVDENIAVRGLALAVLMIQEKREMRKAFKTFSSSRRSVKQRFGGMFRSRHW